MAKSRGKQNTEPTQAPKGIEAPNVLAIPEGIAECLKELAEHPPAECPPADSGQTKKREGQALSGISPEREIAYRPEFCQALVAHFSVLKTDSQGKVIGIPSFVSFGDSIGVSPDTVAAWRKKYPAFASACRHAEALLKAMLIDCALCERVNVTAAKFLLSSLFDLSEEKAPAAAPPALSSEDRALLSNLWERLNRGSLPPSGAD